MHRFPLFSLLPFLVAVAAFVGCGPDRPDMVTVSGKVTFDGGPPPAAGMITFACIEPAPGFDRNPGRAEFDKDGNFTATTFSDGKGLVPGKYKANIQCWHTVPTADGTVGVSYIAADYKSETVTISADESSQTLNFDLPKAKDLPE